MDLMTKQERQTLVTLINSAVTGSGVSGLTAGSISAAATNVTAIQNALNKGGRVVLNTPGVYYINTTLVIPSNTVIYLGPGVELKCTGTTAFSLFRNATFNPTIHAVSSITAVTVPIIANQGGIAYRISRATATLDNTTDLFVGAYFIIDGDTTGTWLGGWQVESIVGNTVTFTVAQPGAIPPNAIGSNITLRLADINVAIVGSGKLNGNYLQGSMAPSATYTRHGVTFNNVINPLVGGYGEAPLIMQDILGYIVCMQCCVNAKVRGLHGIANDQDGAHFYGPQFGTPEIADITGEFADDCAVFQTVDGSIYTPFMLPVSTGAPGGNFYHGGIIRNIRTAWDGNTGQVALYPNATDGVNYNTAYKMHGKYSISNVGSTTDAIAGNNSGSAIGVGATYSMMAVAQYTMSIPNGSTTMTVSAVSKGQLAVGQLVIFPGLPLGAKIVSLGTGTGGTGTYTLDWYNQAGVLSGTAVSKLVAIDEIDGDVIQGGVMTSNANDPVVIGKFQLKNWSNQSMQGYSGGYIRLDHLGFFTNIDGVSWFGSANAGGQPAIILGSWNNNDTVYGSCNRLVVKNVLINNMGNQTVSVIGNAGGLSLSNCNYTTVELDSIALCGNSQVWGFASAFASNTPTISIKNVDASESSVAAIGWSTQTMEVMIDGVTCGPSSAPFNFYGSNTARVSFRNVRYSFTSSVGQGLSLNTPTNHTLVNVEGAGIQVVVPTSGGTVTISNRVWHNQILLAPASALTGITIALPTQPVDGEKLELAVVKNTCGTLTITNGTLAGVTSGTTTAPVGWGGIYRYNAANGVWANFSS